MTPLPDCGVHHTELSTNRQRGLLPGDGAAVAAFQLPENKGGQDGHSAQDEKSLVNVENHFRRVGAKPIGNEERGDQRDRGDALLRLVLLHS